MTSSDQRHHDNETVDPVTHDEIGQHAYQFSREIDPDCVTIESIIVRGKSLVKYTSINFCVLSQLSLLPSVGWEMSSRPRYNVWATG